MKKLARGTICVSLGPDPVDTSRTRVYLFVL